MSAPSVISSATLTFDGTDYKLKSIPSGRPVSCEAIDVTCLDDSKRQFVPGALKINGEISAVIASDAPPAENAKGALALALGGSSVDCGDAVVKSVEPSTIEVGGNREQTWSVVFQPCGADPS